ncbi:dienelactone hydrolase family protein [Fulvivirga lutimaris]|uniref:dienelactone hydrolase family protein n=1 Tax=Fulvivirga lutimaris TaxID=1819566 RepID=UPI0012BCD8A2|nr:dienelactone hydrolase family protein [Fulvivirga lutimaris]MTI38826.1 dienelactone hydrolase [Fulvivirga lutimaris]
MTNQISSYDKWSFTATVSGMHPITHDVYSRGEGKLLVLIQELPGIGQETLALADQFVNRGYKVILPHLFGPLGKTAVLGNIVRIFCMRREFKIFSTQQSSPIVDWLKALCRKVKDDHQVKGVAVIGMCLTGNFAISLMADDAVLASYSSQPSLPIFKQKSLHLSDAEVEKIKTRLDEFGPMHCARFEKDKICQASKFDLYDKTFNQDGKERIKLHTLPGKGHSIVTLDFVDETGHPTKALLKEVIDYFDASLIA